MSRLEAAHGGNGVVIPFAAWQTLKRSVSGQGCLDLIYTIRSGSFLARLFA
jgi:hypothetical protein